MLSSNQDAFFMPFTANRQFRKTPRMLVGAEGMYYTDDSGNKVLDGCAGLWCVNAGHRPRRVVEALKFVVDTIDYVPNFQVGYPLAFEAASRLAALAPADLNHVFFCNSGSEAGDTALKIALAYHRVRGDASRTRLIGRERGYHGVGFGGTAVGGISGNRKLFGTMLPGVDHLRHTHDLARNAFSRGQPEHGAELADDLERLVALHDASTIAAVIVEPMAGSTGALIPPVGYLERLRKICDKHGILLIFDEVITGFGRMGGVTFAAEKFNVIPDIITCAKGITNGTVPMGAAILRDHVFEAFMQGPEAGIDMPHGYTYSGHPLAVAACIATLDTYRDEHIFEHAAEMAPYFEEAAHSLKSLPHVIDIRNLGMVAAIEMEPRAGAPSTRAYDVFDRAFHEGLLVRYTGDTIAISPPLIINKAEIDMLFGKLASLIREVA